MRVHPRYCVQSSKRLINVSPNIKRLTNKRCEIRHRNVFFPNIPNKTLFLASYLLHCQEGRFAVKEPVPPNNSLITFSGGSRGGVPPPHLFLVPPSKTGGGGIIAILLTLAGKGPISIRFHHLTPPIISLFKHI